MNSIYLLRHCDYYNPLSILAGRLPLKLSEAGKENALRLKTYFADKNIGTIYSSAVERCKETTATISDSNIQIQYDQRILETFSAYQGYWDRNKHRDGYHFFSHRGELGGENLADIQKRMASFWDEITASLDENIIICSHADPLQTLYSYIHNQPLVNDNADETDIPGWLQKGEFFEIIWENNTIVETKSKQQV